MTRDFQKKLVYFCDGVLEIECKRRRAGPLSHQAVREYVEEVWACERVVARFSERMGEPPAVNFPARGHNAYANPASVNFLGEGMVDETTVLHELAHVLTLRSYDGSRIAGHGQEFCRVYLDLVECVLGREASNILRVAFDIKGVIYRENKP